MINSKRNNKSKKTTKRVTSLYQLILEDGLKLKLHLEKLESQILTLKMETEKLKR